MQRDMDLIRTLVFEIEKSPGTNPPKQLHVDGYTQDQIGYHLWLMKDAGLIAQIETTSTGAKQPLPSPVFVLILPTTASPGPLTWAGHEFADAVRDETLWNKAKRDIKERVTSASVDIVVRYVKQLATQALSLIWLG